MFSIRYRETDFSTLFRVTETYKTHLGWQAGGGVGPEVGALCVGCDVQSEIGGAKSDEAFGIGEVGSLPSNTVNRWVAKHR